MALHELLSLRHLHDPERIEAAYFADVDPAWPVVEEICLLTEAMTGLLYRIDAETEQPHFELALAA